MDQETLELKVKSTIMHNDPINAQKIKSILKLSINDIQLALYNLRLREVIEIHETKRTGTEWRITRPKEF